MHQMQKVDLLNGRIVPTLMRLTLPIMGTSLVQMAYNLIDMIWIGRVSADAVAAVGAAGMYLWISQGLSTDVYKRQGVAFSVDVSTFIHPPMSAPSGAALYHPPSLTAMTPGIILSVTFAVMRMTPRSLKASTRSPSHMPRADASSGFIQRAVGSSSRSRALISC